MIKVIAIPGKTKGTIRILAGGDRDILCVSQDDDLLNIEVDQAAALWPILKRFAETGEIKEQP